MQWDPVKSSNATELYKKKHQIRKYVGFPALEKIEKLINVNSLQWCVSIYVRGNYRNKIKKKTYCDVKIELWYILNKN